MNGTNGTSRRTFLGRAAGAAAAVAGAGVGAGAIAKSAAAADQRTYTAGRFALELDGVNCGAMVGVDGGDLDGDVILDVVGSDNIQRKHIAGVKYEDFTLQVGAGMGKPMYDWIKASFDKGYQRKNGAVITADYNWNEKRRQSMSQAFISSVTVPALDRASKVPVYIPVSLSCDKVTAGKPSGQPIQAAKQKAWLPSNFVFELDGLDTSRVASIDSFTWKCSVAADGTFVLDVSDIGVSFPQADLSSWQDWYRSMISGANDERDGALTLIGAHAGAVVTFDLSNLGLYRLAPDSTSAIRRVKAEMYCESVSVKFTNASFNQ